MTKRDEQAREYAAERTVRVRIAVAVNDAGQYSAYSATGFWGRTMSDVETMNRTKSGLGGVTLCHWIEADVPLPVPQTIRGEVVQ